MAAVLTYDDSNLQKLFMELEPKRRLSALKGGFRREGNKVRKTAANNLRTSGIRSDSDMEKGIRSLVFKRVAGFRVTVGPKGDRGMHTNRQGLKKPVLLWAETGTEQRRTKGRGRGSHATGRMPRYAFMEKTRSQVVGTVTDDLHEMIADNIIRTAKRYGCR